MLWMTAFLDLPPSSYDAGLAHWQSVTGYVASPPRGAHDELVTLEPPAGDAHLCVQRLASGSARIHLDVHVDDPDAAAAAAEADGGSEIARPTTGHVGMRSPGGFTFCLVDHPRSRPAPPAAWGAGLRSVVDQVCLDIPSVAYAAECRFWRRLTGWELRVSQDRAEFRRLVRPPGQPLQLLLQRLGEETGPVRAHLDLACTDRAAETDRHVALGAEVVHRGPGWTVLRDPTGSVYCVTDRDPGIRVLDRPAED